MAATIGTSGFGTLLTIGDGGTPSTLTTDAGNSGVTYTSVLDGTAGDAITIEYDASGTNASTTVNVVATAITVSVESSSGTPLATALEVADAVNADLAARALVTASLPGDGSGVVTDQGPTNLSGGVDEAFSTIAEVTGLSGPSLSLETIDATHMESPNNFREMIPSLKSAGEVSFDLNFLPGNSSQQQITTDYLGRTLRNFELTWTDTGATKWAFSAYITAFEPSAAIDDKLSASVTLSISGAPNFSA